MAAKNFTDEELRQVAAFVTHRYLEVERGLRDRRSLKPFLSPDAYAQQATAAASRFGGGTVVRHSDIGKVNLQRHRPDRAHVTVSARQEGERWGGLVMEMRADPRGTWRITELTRVQDRNLVKPQPVPDHTDTESHQAALDRVIADLDAATIARRAAAERFLAAESALAKLARDRLAGEIIPGDTVNVLAPRAWHWIKVEQILVDPDGPIMLRADNGALHTLDVMQHVHVLDRRVGSRPEARVTGPDVRFLEDSSREFSGWDHIVTALQGEKADLERQLDLARKVQEVNERVEGPAYLVRLLGARPSPAPERRAWNKAAMAVLGYRRRWDITSTDTALGAPPTSAGQKGDRAETLAAVRSAMTLSGPDRRLTRRPAYKTMRREHTPPFWSSLG